MYAITFVLPFGWLLFLYAAILQYRTFRSEINFLPPLDHPPVLPDHYPLLHTNIREFLHLPELPERSLAVLMIASAHCRACSGDMEEMLLANQTLRVPFFCYVGAQDEASFREFERNYRAQCPVLLTSPHLAKELYIELIPSYLIVDSAGTILANPPTVQAVVATLSSWKGGERP